MTWTDASRCRTVPGFTDLHRLEAKRLCLTCPVLEACLWAAMAEEAAVDEAVGMSLRHFVRGGLTGSERATLSHTVTPAEVASRLADELTHADDARPELEGRRRRACAGCGRPIQHRGGTPTRYCSHACRMRWRWTVPGYNRKTLARRRALAS